MSAKKNLKRLREELIRFENAMEELHFFKLVAEDLKSFKRMINLKRYD